MSTKQIDAGLARYYQQKGIQYIDKANGIGKFIEWCNINGYNTESVKEELKRQPFECTLVEFDQEFPTKKTKFDRTKEIFSIIKQCFHDANAYIPTQEDTETKHQPTIDHGLVRYNANTDENEEVRLCSRLCTLLEMDQEENIEELEKLLQICNKAKTKFSDAKNRFYKMTYNKVMNKFTAIPMCMDILYDIGFNKSHDNKKLLCKSSKSTIKLLNKTRDILNCMVHDIFSEEGHRFDAELLLHGYARHHNATIYRDVCDMILTMLNIDKEHEMSFVFHTENLDKYKKDNGNQVSWYINNAYSSCKMSDCLWTCRMSDDLIFDNIKYLTINIDGKLLNSESDNTLSKKTLREKLFEWYGVQMTVTQIKKVLRRTALKSFVMKPCRPLISKFYQRMMNMKFNFDSNHQKIRIGDDGISAMKQKFDSGTIRFGPFLHFENNNEDNLKSYKIIFDTRSVGSNSSIGIGFATHVFNDWIRNNFGNNNSCLVKGNGQFYTTEHLFNGEKRSNKSYKNGQYIDGCNNSYGFFKEGDDVIVNVDLKNLNGVISANGRKVKIGLPKDDAICIIVYMSGSAKKKIMVKDQKFIFNDE